MSHAHRRALLATLPVLLTACADTIVYKINDETVIVEDTNDPGVEPTVDLPITPTVSADQLQVDVFGQDGNTWWMNVSDAAIEKLNESWGGGAVDYVEYEPDSATGTQNLLIVTPDGQAGDFGQVSLALPDLFTSSPWTPTTIPTFFFLDADAFVEGQRFGGVERVVLDSTGRVSMFGATSALAIFRAMALPAARTALVWVGGSGWENDELLIPMVLREAYSQDFCEENAALLGGGCKTVREFNGEPTNETSWANTTCHHGDCADVSRLAELGVVTSAHFGRQSFDEGTAPYLDWPQLHRSACVHWLLWIGDDYNHQGYNVVLAEGEDGLFRLLPLPMTAIADYASPGSYTNTPLFGTSRLSVGCERDDGCRTDQLDTCEEVIDQFEALDPASLIDDLAERLRATQAPWGDYPDGMWRAPDDGAYEHYRTFYETRAESARAELAAYRAARSVN
jgi:hypothetical protein